MEVTKRNGQKEEVRFDKISSRLRILCNLFGFKTVDPILIAQKTIILSPTGDLSLLLIRTAIYPRIDSFLGKSLNHPKSVQKSQNRYEKS